MKNLLFALVALVSVSSFADWSFDNNLLTATSGRSEGMVLKATLSGTRVTVTGIQTRPDGMTIVDLQGAVTKLSDGTELSIVSIGGLKFTGLTELYLPLQLEAIADSSMFDGCSTLTTVSPMFPPTFKSFPSGGYVFRNCSSLTGDVSLVNAALTSIPSCMFQNTRITSLNYTDTAVATLGNFVCESCSALTNVTPLISDNISSLGTCAFANCSKLEGELRIHNTSITAIPNSFMTKAKITSIDFGECPITSIGSSAFIECGKVVDVKPFLPATLKSIGENAFRDCPAITNSLFLSNAQMTALPVGAFNTCRRISSVDLTGTAITSIGSYCFQYCEGVKDFRPLLPDTVQTIGSGAFTSLGATNMIYLTHCTMTSMPPIFGSCKCEGIDMTGSAFTTFADACFQYAAFKKVVFPIGTDSIGYDSCRSINASQGIFFRGPPPTTINQRAFIGIGDNWTIRGAYVLPKEYRAQWLEYINADPCVVAELTEAQRKKFAIAGLAKPTQSLRMNKNQYDSYPLYLCWWHSLPGMMIIAH